MKPIFISAQGIKDGFVVKVDLGKEKCYLEKWENDTRRASITDVIRNEMTEYENECYFDALTALDEIIDTLAFNYGHVYALAEWTPEK